MTDPVPSGGPAASADQLRRAADIAAVEADNHDAHGATGSGGRHAAVAALLRAAADDPGGYEAIKSALVSYAGNDHYLLVRSGEMARVAAEAVDLALGRYIDQVAAVLLADVEDEEPSS